MSTKLRNRDKDTFFYEKRAAESGCERVAGIDEAGRGPLAGPVVAAAVVIHDPGFTERIDDSKKLTERMREKAFFDILNRCDVGIGVVEVEDVDRLNIFNATLLAMERAVKELRKEPDHLLIDGRMEPRLPQAKTCLIRGESLSVSIACASIIAKVFRDKIMVEQDAKYPEYGFKQHKGYGTPGHIKAIERYGLSPIHRQTFGPFGGKSRKAGRKNG